MTDTTQPRIDFDYLASVARKHRDIPGQREAREAFHAAFGPAFALVLLDLARQAQPREQAAQSGAHHLTSESIVATIKDLREIEDGTTEHPVACRDWRTWAGVLARIIEHLASTGAAPEAPDSEQQAECKPYFRDLEFDPPSGLFTTAANLDHAPAATVDAQADTQQVGAAVGTLAHERIAGMSPLSAATTASASGEPEGWRAFIENCACTGGGMVYGNKLAIAAKELLGRAPARSRVAGKEGEAR